VVASWQSDFCLLFKLIEIFDLLSMGKVQTCASTQSVAILFLNDFVKLNGKNHIQKHKRALRDRNANKATVLLRRSNYVFVVGYCC